jgi:ABC-type dipeptide/oligopeptide/nickel transport system permease subunit
LAKPTFVLPGMVIVALVVISLFPGFFAGLFGNGDPYHADLAYSQDGPCPGHPFGFDLQGRDIWANVIYGTRTSVAVGLTATVLSMAIALVLGTAAGYRPGLVDSLITRLTEVFLGFPFLLAAIVVLNSVSRRDVWSVSLVLGVFGWPALARLVRASVRQVCQLDYVVAARVAGLPSRRIIIRHVLPNAITPVLILATIGIGAVIVAESSLTYLGVGLQQPTISWGLQIAAGSRNFQTAPHMLVFSSAFLSLTVLAIICLGEALRSSLDPKRLA